MLKGTRIGDNPHLISTEEITKNQKPSPIQTSSVVNKSDQLSHIKSRKTYEGTNIRARNPIIVTMLIMQLVTDSLKDAADKTKEITKLNKQAWKLYSDGQSENFKKGEAAQNFAVAGKIVKLGCDLIAPKCKGKNFAFFNLSKETVINGAGTLFDQIGSNYPQQKATEIQIEQAKFEHKVGHASTDYQNQSQQLSSDNQMVDSAREKNIQIGRLMAQLITAQPA